MTQRVKGFTSIPANDYTKEYGYCGGDTFSTNLKAQQKVNKRTVQFSLDKNLAFAVVPATATEVPLAQRAKTAFVDNFFTNEAVPLTLLMTAFTFVATLIAFLVTFDPQTFIFVIVPAGFATLAIFGGALANPQKKYVEVIVDKA